MEQLITKATVKSSRSRLCKKDLKSWEVKSTGYINRLLQAQVMGGGNFADNHLNLVVFQTVCPE